MFWNFVDQFTQSDLRKDHHHTIRARIAIAFGVMMTATALGNSLVLSITGLGRPGMALLGLAGAFMYAATAYAGGRFRKPDISIAVNLAITLIITVLAAWGNRGGFPPAAIYLPGILLGVYIAWGRVGAMVFSIPLILFFAGVVWLANMQTVPGTVVDGAAAPTLVLVLACVAACGWAVFLGSTFRSATMQAYSELSHALEAAEAGNRSKSEFLSNMGHETRTPLNGVLGLTMALRMEGGLSEKQENILELMTESGETLLEMLTDVLDLAQLDTASATTEKQHFLLSDLIERASARWIGTAKAKNLNWSVDLMDMSHPCLFGDVEKLRQTLEHILSNAVKFTANGSVKIAVRQSQDPRTRVVQTCIEVTDTGIGIAPEHRQDIFNPFHQVDSSKTRLYGGAGLGLAMASRLTKILGGTLSIHSEAGQGTTLTIDLPLQRGDQHSIPTQPLVQQPILLNSDIRILLVEESRTNQLVLQSSIKDSLTGGRVQFDSVRTGKSALNHFGRQSYDVVLIDLQMSDMSGETLMTSMRQRESAAHTKMLAMLPPAAAYREEELLAAGFDHVLLKPINSAALRRVFGLLYRSNVA